MAAAALIVLPWDFRQALIVSLLASLICLSYVVITGFVGQISVVQLALAGVAGYTVSHMAVDFGIEFPLAPLIAVAIATVLGLLVAVSALRVRGVSLAVVTLAAAVAIEKFGFANYKWGGGSGASPVPRPKLFGFSLGPDSSFRGLDGKLPSPVFGFFLLAVIVALCLVIANVRRSSVGRQMLAVRSNERAAAAAGVNVTVVKLVGFGLSAFIAGVAGVMYSYEFGGVSAAKFGAFAALGLIAFTYVGGITMISGAFVAGLISTSGLVSYALDKWFGLSGNWALLFAGVALDRDADHEPRRRRRRQLQDAAEAAPPTTGGPGRGRGARGGVVSAAGSFPNPYEIETPPGCEGWEEMYPYYALFDERRRETDEQRFWFWNSMHFPLPMPAFDIACVDVPYQGIGTWQNRVFAVPPAMGIDYRVVNGYVYISGNPVTDPEKIAERAEFFQKRAGYYFENWDELYGKWKVKMEALIAELTELRVPDLQEYEPDEVVFEDDRDTAYVEVLEAYGRLLRCGELMWQHHSEFLLLGYGAYATFVDFCKGSLPDIPDQHIAQMVAGIDVLLFRPDAELKRLARLAIETGVDSAFVEGRSPEEIDDELAQ